MKSIKYLILSLLFMTSCNNETTTNEDASIISPELLAMATAIHERVMVLDTHIDFNVKNFTDTVNYTQDLDNQVTLPKMKAGGLDVAWLVVYTGQDSLNEAGYAKAYQKAMGKFNAIHKLTKEIAPDQIGLAVTSEEARNIYKSGKKVAMIGVENGYPIGTDINRVKEFYDLGARYMSLAHNGHSQLCDSNTGEKDSVWLHNGVSEVGKQVIAEMNKWGMMIDISHPAKSSIKDMIELSKAPIIASHSSCRALCDHSRNLDDEQLEWMKENGGVVQAVAFRSYVNKEKGDKYRDAFNAFMEEIGKDEGFKIIPRSEVREMEEEARDAYYDQYRAMRKLANARIEEVNKIADPVNVADFIDHIDYLVKKLGMDHVGISSDFDGGGGIGGWKDASETLNVTIELVKRGYTEEQIDKLWSGNLLRVLDEVQAVAEKIQSEEG